jgi:AraC-like DNA-binding protein
MKPEEMLSTPELAIRTFEKIHNLSIVVHDLTTRLWPILPPERFRHCSAHCLAVKRTHDWACHEFEIARLRGEIARFPEGRYHICHAGFFEWVVPAYIENRLSWVLFAGQRRPAGKFPHLVRDPRRTQIDWGLRKPPPPVREQHAELVLEVLRQLRSRLLQWREQAARDSVERDFAGQRRLAIERYIYDRHTGGASVAGLARELHLSPSRAIHLVKELFGRSYIKLVSEMRLRTAASLLRETSRPILDVCLESGFQDLSHFHRLFRRRFGVTPRSYRRLPPA